MGLAIPFVIYNVGIMFWVKYHYTKILFYLQVVNIGPRHICTSTSKVTGKEATAAWIGDRVKKMLLTNGALGAKAQKERLEGQFNVTLSYSKVWEGRKCALKDIQCT